MFKMLKAEIEAAKKRDFPIHNLYRVLGRITMARDLKAITHEEFMDLNHLCVQGINNPELIEKNRAQKSYREKSNTPGNFSTAVWGD